ncbi:MAG: hydantoinase/oxoprolinase N-terminal domain-containing protein [Candidatus Acidiferrales bacterium]
MTARVSVDIGGTFTDLVPVREGRVGAIAKELTTPEDLPRYRAELKAAPRRRAHERLRAGPRTMLVSNALIERRLAAAALVTTTSFKDVFGIGREQRDDLYDLIIKMPRPLISRCLRWEVSERVLADVELPGGLLGIVGDEDVAGFQLLGRELCREVRHGSGQRVRKQTAHRTPAARAALADRIESSAVGYAGGEAPNPKLSTRMAAGTGFTHLVPGGGGSGPAGQHRRDLIEEDLAEGLVSAQGARDSSGYEGGSV